MNVYNKLFCKKKKTNKFNKNQMNSNKFITNFKFYFFSIENYQTNFELIFIMNIKLKIAIK